MHRDVKLENILLDCNHAIKLIDFGLAANITPSRKLKVHCGSPSYAAPEIVARRLYDGPPVDVWSLGVVLYGMICGHLPFHATDNKKVSFMTQPLHLLRMQQMQTQSAGICLFRQQTCSRQQEDQCSYTATAF